LAGVLLNKILLRGFWCVLLAEVILPRLTEDIPMNIQHFTAITPLRARMIADMTARNLGPASRSSHLHACKRFPVFTSARLAKATNMDFVRSNLEEKDS
jgi:integrase/recombinase XerD